MESAGRAGARQVAGFLLVGGLSRRMGRDQALLGLNPQGRASGSRALAEQIADSVRKFVGNVTLNGDPRKRAPLGRPVIADAVSGCSPGGGDYAMLLHSKADWNRVVACDLPPAPGAGACVGA